MRKIKLDEARTKVHQAVIKRFFDIEDLEEAKELIHAYDLLLDEGNKSEHLDRLQNRMIYILARAELMRIIEEIPEETYDEDYLYEYIKTLVSLCKKNIWEGEPKLENDIRKGEKYIGKLLRSSFTDEF